MPDNFPDIAIAQAPSSRPAAIPITERQEHAWLQQQQDPDTVWAALLGFRLTGGLDAARMIRALHELPSVVPQLSHSLKMTDDGELCALPVRVSARLHNTASEAEATALLRELQTAPWDTESEAPFRCALVLLPEGAMLGLAFHALAGGPDVADASLRALAGIYSGNPPPHPVEIAPIPPQDVPRPGPDPLAGLRSDTQATISQPIRLALETTASTGELACQLAAAITEVTGGPAPDISTIESALPDLALALPLNPPVSVARLIQAPLVLDGISAAQLPLDTACTGSGLFVGLREGEGLEMIAGSDISPMAAGLVLERCAARLKSGATDVPAVAASDLQR